MADPRQPMFLERDSYRRRRLGDAARLVPVMGFLLLLLPAFMTVTVEALLFIFGVWAVLILVIGVLSRRLVVDRVVPGTADPDDPPEA